MDEDEYADNPWWSNFSGAVADSLGISEHHLTPQSSFDEIGGSSLNAVSAVLKLQKSGFPITLEQFLESQNLGSLFASVTKSGGATSTGHKFLIKSLAEVDKSEAQKLVAESFLYKTELFTKCGDMQLHDFISVYEKWWNIFPQYSCAVVDETNKLRAVALAADDVDMKNTSLEGAHAHFVAIAEMLHKETKELREQYNPNGIKGLVLSKFMFGGALDNTADENVTAFVMLEKEMINIAKRSGFSLTFAENTSPLTQQLSEYLGCSRRATWQINRWVDPHGKKPFAECSDSYTSTVDVYIINR